jgi:hypothetical protein
MKNKISIIVWDADFRERLHTIDCFANQNFPENEYELIWVDYYSSNQRIMEKLKHFSNCKLICLGHEPHVIYHSGICRNVGAEYSSGDILVFPDGDIYTDPQFLRYVSNKHEQPSLAVYYRRYDQPSGTASDENCRDIDWLERNTRLLNPTNFGGCLSIRRCDFHAAGGFEEHSVFAGRNMSAMELYFRLSNAGISIQWSSDKKLYHPYHQKTLGSNLSQEQILVLKIARVHHPWIFPAAGLEQSWISHCRKMNLDTVADKNSASVYLRQMPIVDVDRYRALSTSISQQYYRGRKSSFMCKLLRKVERLRNG